MQRKGQPISLRFEYDDDARVRAFIEDRGLMMSAVLRRWILEKLEEEEREGGIVYV